jgi:uncharacterized membrane protein
MEIFISLKIFLLIIYFFFTIINLFIPLAGIFSIINKGYSNNEDIIIISITFILSFLSLPLTILYIIILYK